MTPDRPTCHYEDDDGNQFCIGVRAYPYPFCLAHLAREQRDAWLAKLEPGSIFSVRDTLIDGDLLIALRAALGRSGAHQFGQVDFTGSQFTGRPAFFDQDQFSGPACFNRAQFAGDAFFAGAHFAGTARFHGAHFAGDAMFEGVHFTANAEFEGAHFAGDARFNGALFGRDASFVGAQFSRDVRLGPLSAARLDLHHVSFAQPAIIEAAASALSCTETRFESRVTLRVRYAHVVMDRAVFKSPSSVAYVDEPFPPVRVPGGVDSVPLDEAQIASASGPAIPHLMSAQEVDVTNLVVTDMDLSACRFSGAHNLDKLRLEGRIVFSRTPQGFRFGWAWPPVWRWTRRQVLAEERTWRARPGARKRAGWQDKRPPEPLPVVGPERLATLYRALRKAREDSKDEPGAADFYYGEMDMRRHAPSTPRAERFILTLYWLISGYGLRASRALLILAGLIAAAAFGLQQAGFPCTGRIYTACPQQSFVGSLLYAAGSVLSLDLKVGGLPAALTTWGQLLRILLRVSGPVLLGLAALAVRGRVKR